MATGTSSYSQHTPVGELKGSVGGVSIKGVGTEHPEYKTLAPLWDTIDDCIAGEPAIKTKKEKYLPRPSGMTRDVEGNLAYKSYITRAHFPDFTSKFLSGLTGITKINPPKVKVPKSMEYLIDDCDGNNTPLDVFFFQSVRLSLKTGRQLIFADIDQKKDRIKLVRYSAQELINWGVVNRVYDGKEADYFVLREKINTSDNIFLHEYENQYRVLTTSNILNSKIEDKIFTSAVFDENGSLVEKIAIPSLRGKKFNGLPIVIIGSTDIEIEPDQVPLLGVSLCALQMYMKDADLSNAMFLTCNPTLCMSGVSPDSSVEGSVLVGSNISITMEDPNARAYYTKTDASGLAEVRLAIKTYLEEAKHAGSALLSGDQQGVESGEALRIKAASTTASLATTSQATARGFEKTFRYIAEWMGEKPEKVSVVVDSDYLDNMLTPEYIAQLVKLFEANMVSRRSSLDKLKEGRFLDSDFNVEEEISEIEKEIEVETKEQERLLQQQNINKTNDPAEDGMSDSSQEIGTSDTSEDMQD